MPPLINDVILTEEGRRRWNAAAEEIRRVRAAQAKADAPKVGESQAGEAQKGGH